MATFVQYGQLQKCVRNFLSATQNLFEAGDGLLRPEDHPITLTREMQEVRALAGDL